MAMTQAYGIDILTMLFKSQEAKFAKVNLEG